MFNRGASAFGGGAGARSSASIASGSRDRLSPCDNPPHVPGCRLQPVEFAEVGAGAFSDEVREGERPADTLAPAGMKPAAASSVTVESKLRPCLGLNIGSELQRVGQ
jgi:hypothetical protein